MKTQTQPTKSNLLSGAKTDLFSIAFGDVCSELGRVARRLDSALDAIADAKKAIRTLHRRREVLDALLQDPRCAHVVEKMLELDAFELKAEHKALAHEIVQQGVPITLESRPGDGGFFSARAHVVAFPKAEFKLLQLLVKHGKQGVSVETIQQSLGNCTRSNVTTRINRIRKRLLQTSDPILAELICWNPEEGKYVLNGYSADQNVG